MLSQYPSILGMVCLLSSHLEVVSHTMCWFCWWIPFWSLLLSSSSIQLFHTKHISLHELSFLVLFPLVQNTLLPTYCFWLLQHLKNYQLSLPCLPWFSLLLNCSMSSHLNCPFVFCHLEHWFYHATKLKLCCPAPMLLISFAAVSQWFLPLDKIPYSFIWTSCYSKQFLPASHATSLYSLIPSYISVSVHDLRLFLMSPRKTT